MGEQQFILQQDGTKLSGEQKGEIFQATFKGKVNADHVTLTSMMAANGYEVPFIFTGVVTGNNLLGRRKAGRIRSRNFHRNQSLMFKPRRRARLYSRAHNRSVDKGFRG